MALWIGLPLARSKISVVSRWLVMPIAAMSGTARPAAAMASRQVASTVRHKSSGFMFDPAGLRKVLGKFMLGNGRDGTIGTEHDGAGGSGALVDGENVVGH